MKTKTALTNKVTTEKTTLTAAKAKSLRPMRSLVAKRSFKPKTVVASLLTASSPVEKPL